MLVPDDPRFDELLRLAGRAPIGFTGLERDRWRELCTALLGSLRDAGLSPERRNVLRANASLPVAIESPLIVAGLHTSTVGSGGLSIDLPEPLPVGIDVHLVLRPEGEEPLAARARVVWARPAPQAAIGACFIDLLQHHRERLEATAVRALLAQSAAG